MHTYIYIHICIYIYLYTCVCMCVRACVCMHMYTYVYIHVYMYILQHACHITSIDIETFTQCLSTSIDIETFTQCLTQCLHWVTATRLSYYIYSMIDRHWVNVYDRTWQNLDCIGFLDASRCAFRFRCLFVGRALENTVCVCWPRFGEYRQAWPKTSFAGCY